MTILALEFSSEVRSVGVRRERQVFELTDRSKTSNVQLISRLLVEARVAPEEIQRIAVGIGPGSYNGIRSALAIAQGWQLAQDADLVGVSSALCVAHGARAAGVSSPFEVVIDAQRREFYVSRYESDGSQLRETIPLAIVPAAEITRRHAAGVNLVGPGLDRWCPGAAGIFPSAAILLKLSEGIAVTADGAALEPIYLRPTAFVKAPGHRS